MAAEKDEIVQENKENVEDKRYSIIYENKNLKGNGITSYYVLIEGINLENDDFKNEVVDVVKNIISEKGNSITIDLYDDENVLELVYKSHYGENSLGRILTTEEMENNKIHLIVTYDGEKTMEPYKNTLSFFPMAFKDDPTVGKYMEEIKITL